jgi:hypothetical protein
MNDRFGSFAALRDRIRPMAAFGGEADVRFGQKPIFDSPLTANSGHQLRKFVLLRSRSIP